MKVCKHSLSPSFTLTRRGGHQPTYHMVDEIICLQETSKPQEVRIT